jgi:lipopolysaccharide/colanic/teichoic acid biosynthesis glycosyltransferase
VVVLEIAVVTKRVANVVVSGVKLVIIIAAVIIVAIVVAVVIGVVGIIGVIPYMAA